MYWLCLLPFLPNGQGQISQIHLAIGGEGSRDMIVTFRVDGPPETKVCWGEDERHLSRIALPRRSISYWSGAYVSALLSPLEPKTKYYYAVSDDSSNCSTHLSTIRNFVSPPTKNDEVTLIVYGDMGFGEVGHSVQSRKVLEEMKKQAHAVIHAGDISYADDSFLRRGNLFKFTYEKVYDEWMNWMENITDALPYMVSVGNHESECHSALCVSSMEKRRKLGNFTAYNSRWHMPSEESGGALSMWYSYDFGPAHFISINTETDFEGAAEEKYGDCVECKIPSGSFGKKGEYLKWLEEDLKKAHANRENRPWVFVHGHRPLYGRSSEDCADATLCRTFEHLFDKYKVNAYLNGHDHVFSRLKPRKAQAVYYISLGGIGCDERKKEDFISGNGTNARWEYVLNGKHTTIGTLQVSRTSAQVQVRNVDTGDIIDHIVLDGQITPEEILA